MSDRPLGEADDDYSGDTTPQPLSIRTNMLWNSVGSLTYLGFQWLITVLVVRLSDGYAAAGVLALAMTVFNIFGPVAIYRMYTYQVSDVRHENSVGEYVTFRALTSGLALAGCLIYAIITCPPQTWLAIGLYAVFKICALFIDVLHAADQVNARMDYIGRSLMMQGVLTFAAFIGVFSWTASLELALVGMAVVTVLVGLVYDVPRARQFAAIKLGISRTKAGHLLTYCLPIVLAAVACAVAPSIPRQFLAAVDGESALGIYASVAAPAAIIQMGANYIYNPLLTVFSVQYLERRTKDLTRLFVKVVGTIAVIGVVLAVVLELAGPWLLTLMFGERIAPYTYLLFPIIVNTVVSGYVWFFSDLLVALRCFVGSFVGNIAAVLIALPATYFFVNTWDMNGVSFTGILSYGIGALIMGGYLLHTFKRRTPAAD